MLVAHLGRLLELQRVGQAIICACRSAITSCCSPSRKRSASCTSRAYARPRPSPTQGPEQRWIWYSRQGRVRLVNTVSSQVRSRNTFCSSWIVSFTAQALGYGPK